MDEKFVKVTRISKKRQNWPIFVVKKPKGFCVAESEYFVDKSRNLYKINSSIREKNHQFHENFYLLCVPRIFLWIMVVEIRDYRL